MIFIFFFLRFYIFQLSLKYFVIRSKITKIKGNSHETLGGKKSMVTANMPWNIYSFSTLRDIFSCLNPVFPSLIIKYLRTQILELFFKPQSFSQ